MHTYVHESCLRPLASHLDCWLLGLQYSGQEKEGMVIGSVPEGLIHVPLELGVTISNWTHRLTQLSTVFSN